MFKSLLMFVALGVVACGDHDHNDQTGGDSDDGGDSVTASTVPTDPVSFTANQAFTIDGGNYILVPDSYDATHQTPSTLFVWFHGCGGESAGDIYNVSPADASQTWISLAPIGAEDDCWDPNTQITLVLTAIANIKTHFNIDPKSVILGGYSSGGDLTYRTAFYHADQFAGVLIENSSPFRDTGSTQAQSLAAASWKFNVVHLAHLQDETYPIAGVRTETDALHDAGFPMTRIEKTGTHYDAANAVVDAQTVPGTDADVVTYLLPYLGAGWRAP